MNIFEPKQLTPNVAQLTKVDTIQDLSDLFLEIANEAGSNEKLKQIADHLTKEEQQHLFDLLDIACAYEENNDRKAIIEIYQLNKIEK